ncbi:MAG: di-trans,poly-cis-decaprenylcistransferase [Gemmatimonadota bacterium]
MIQRSFHTPSRGLHVAIIMDGNGRWASSRGLPRTDGHRAGAKAVRRTVEAARSLGIRTLTLYAFSSDNWRRPGAEVGALMRIFREYLEGEVGRCVAEGIRLNVVGRRDRLAPSLVRAIEVAEAATSTATELQLRVAVDYSSRDAIVAAAGRGPDIGIPTRDSFSRALAEVMHASGTIPNVDLLIRTGGERRLSDFLLWECAYAELVFVECPWPEFGLQALQEALEEFDRRERRFGGIENTVTSGVTPDRAEVGR